jgi:carboxyl-terminal processing protease
MFNKKSILLFLSGFLIALLLVMALVSTDQLVLLPDFRYEALKTMESNYEKVEKLKNEIVENFYLPLDEETLYEGMVEGLFEAVGDPYTQYMNVDDFNRYKDSTKGKYVGIGILSDTSRERIEILRVYPNSPAEAAGILAGDEVFQVDDLTIEADGYEALINQMLGQEGDEVLVKVYRDNDIIDFDMTRQQVKIPFVDSHLLGETGYIYIHQFGTNASKEFEKHLDALMEENITGLIVDLRDNPGGLVVESTKIADQLLGKGLIVYTLDNEGNERTYRSKSSHVDLPLIFLANEKSASASEILLGAIKDQNRAAIVGNKTFGKGIVQSVNPIDDGSGYKITYAQYYSPLGNEIHKKGIEPDYKVDFEGRINIETPDLENDRQLLKALELLNKK